MGEYSGLPDIKPLFGLGRLKCFFSWPPDHKPSDQELLGNTPPDHDISEWLLSIRSLPIRLQMLSLLAIMPLPSEP